MIVRVKPTPRLKETTIGTSQISYSVSGPVKRRQKPVAVQGRYKNRTGLDMRVGSLSSQNSQSFRDMVFMSSDVGEMFKNDNTLLSKTSLHGSPKQKNPVGRNGGINQTYDA